MRTFEEGRRTESQAGRWKPSLGEGVGSVGFFDEHGGQTPRRGPGARCPMVPSLVAVGWMRLVEHPSEDTDHLRDGMDPRGPSASWEGRRAKLMTQCCRGKDRGYLCRQTRCRRFKRAARKTGGKNEAITILRPSARLLGDFAVSAPRCQFGQSARWPMRDSNSLLAAGQGPCHTEDRVRIASLTRVRSWSGTGPGFAALGWREKKSEKSLF